MLILEKDYITIDLEHTGDREMCDGSKNWDNYWLIFTIQVNGKLKRHTTMFQTTTEWERKSLQPVRREWIQEALALLDGIGYELPDIMEMQQKIQNALDEIE